MSRLRAYILLLIVGVALGGCRAGSTSSSMPAPSSTAVPTRNFDIELERAATAALGDREGTVLIIDPQNGRLIAAVNPRLAFEQVYPPGSAIKPFTALAALRTGVIDAQTGRACRGRYRRPDFEIVCSHRSSRSGFDLPQALGYSCNDYFATLSERLSESAFVATLVAFGFGSRTGINAGGEATGSLPQGDWHPRVALGESDGLLVTPIQLLSAYAALFGDGKLYRPQLAGSSDFRPALRSSFRILPAHRSAILEGMRGVITFGTAAESGLASTPLTIVGKTGTSTTSQGFRTQGWFVGFASKPQASLGVLVFLKRAHGAECASLAKPLFDVFAQQNDTPPLTAKADQVRVHLVAKERTINLEMADYLTGVLAAEGSTESEPEALKALSIVIRTFAARNRGRHATQGYDFCSTTHCQRFIEPPYSGTFETVARETDDEILRDDRESTADVYFHAACGGVTADIHDLWGTAPLSYLRGVRDDYCVGAPNGRWVDRIGRNQLLSALKADSRSDVGARLDDVVVTKHDPTGRAEWMALEGARRRLVRGWDFKIIVGRTLGWNLLKSSRFEVHRQGEEFLFRGSGFGHGLGLCQEGAHVAARRGIGYAQILNHYFPGLQTQRKSADSLRTFKTERFVLRVPHEIARTDVDLIVGTLEKARVDLMERLRSAGLASSEAGPVEVLVHRSTVDFISETGQPGWVGAATRGLKISLQPIDLLRRRGVLATTLRHEYAHVVIEFLGNGGAPRWLAEGLAINFAGEGRMFSDAKVGPEISLEELERRLTKPAASTETRALYGAAYRAVRDAIAREGEAAVWRRCVEGR